MRIGKADNGFTLIEILIVLVVLGIGIFSLYSMQIRSIKGNAKAQAITAASNTVRDTIEQMLGKDFNDSDFSVSGNPHQITSGLPSGISSISWEVTDWSSDDEDNDNDSRVDEFDERGVKSIQLNVRYTDLGISNEMEIHYLKTELL